MSPVNFLFLSCSFSSTSMCAVKLCTRLPIDNDTPEAKFDCISRSLIHGLKYIGLSLSESQYFLFSGVLLFLQDESQFLDLTEITTSLNQLGFRQFFFPILCNAR